MTKIKTLLALCLAVVAASAQVSIARGAHGAWADAATSCSVQGGASCTPLWSEAHAPTGRLAGAAGVQPGLRGSGSASASSVIRSYVTPPAKSSAVSITVNATVAAAEAREAVDPVTGVDDPAGAAMTYLAVAIDGGCGTCGEVTGTIHLADSSGPRAPRLHPGGPVNITLTLTHPAGERLKGQIGVHVWLISSTVAGEGGIPSAGPASASGDVTLDSISAART